MAKLKTALTKFKKAKEKGDVAAGLAAFGTFCGTASETLEKAESGKGRMTAAASDDLEECRAELEEMQAEPRAAGDAGTRAGFDWYQLIPIALAIIEVIKKWRDGGGQLNSGGDETAEG